MQAIILAAGRGIRLNRLTENQTKCMVKINDVTLIERMLKQLDHYKLNRIVIVDGYQAENLEQFVNSLKICTKINFIRNEAYLTTNNIYSLYLASDELAKDDSLVIESDIVFEDQILKMLLLDKNEAVAVIDKYKSWMTGKGVQLDEKGEIVGFLNENKIDHNQIKSSYKTVGIYKFGSTFFQKYYQPFLKAYIEVFGSNGQYEQVLRVLTADGNTKVHTCLVGDYNWYEINDIQDVDLATTLFSADEERVTEAMLGRWGGYWRYPQYMDYFYLVTPYYPTKTLIEEMKANFEELLVQYPSGMKVNSLLAAKEFMVEPENIVIGNGAAELIKSLMERLSGDTGFIRPTFEEYANRYTKDKKIEFYINNENFSYSSNDIISFFSKTNICNLILINPDNPSGNYILKKDLIKLLDWAKEKNIKVVIDESFADFAEEENNTLIKQSILNEYPNLYAIKSISKSYGVPGLRLGVLASGDTNTIAFIKKDVAIWNINSFAEFYMQIAGKYKKDYQVALQLFKHERKEFEQSLKELPQIRVIPSQANYVMVELLGKVDAEIVKRRMLIDHHIFIKTLGKKIKTNRQFLRLAIRDRADNERFIQALKDVLSNT